MYFVNGHIPGGTYPESLWHYRDEREYKQMADTDLNLNFSQKYDEGAAGGSKYEETSNPLANTLSIPAPAGENEGGCNGGFPEHEKIEAL